MEDRQVLVYLALSGKAFEQGSYFTGPESNYGANLMSKAIDTLENGVSIGRVYLKMVDGVKFPEETEHAAEVYAKARRERLGLDVGLWFCDYRLSHCSICGSQHCEGWH